MPLLYILHSHITINTSVSTLGSIITINVTKLSIYFSMIRKPEQSEQPRIVKNTIVGVTITAIGNPNLKEPSYLISQK